MLTAISATDAIINAFKNYASAYITKPFTKDYSAQESQICSEHTEAAFRLIWQVLT